MAEREQIEPVHNEGAAPLTIVLEPWGIREEVAPGDYVLVVARGPQGGQLEITRVGDEITFFGWSESRVAVVRDAERAKALYASSAK